MTASSTCPRCGGFRLPPAYIGDVIGPVCHCWPQYPEQPHYYHPMPTITTQPDEMRFPTVAEIRRIIKEEIEKALKDKK